MPGPSAHGDSTCGGPRTWLAWAWSTSIVRYLLVGGMLFVIGVVVLFTAVRGAGLDVRIGEALSRVIGATIGFFAHKYVSFRKTDGTVSASVARQGAAYAILAVANVLIAPWVLYVIYGVLHPHLVCSKILSDAVMVCETYVLLRVIFWSKADRLWRRR